jgi:retron-type reverse transcriptase
VLTAQSNSDLFKNICVGLYILQCDVRKYFPSIDHEILKGIIRRKLKCPDTLWLIETIIDASNEQENTLAYFPGDELWTPHERRRGLPIGNLTSQFFANVYLNGLDHFVYKRLGVSKYVRYVDDLALFGDERAELVVARTRIEEYLAELRLRIHPVKSQLFETRHGASFVGFRVLPERIRVRNGNLQRARQRFRRLQAAYQRGLLDWERIKQSLQSWSAHLAHGDTWQLRVQVFSTLAFTRG